MNTVIRTHSNARPTEHQHATDSKVIRLAIVGCGPRGLQCLESLSRQLSERELSRLAITVFEPASFPGAGCVYDPEQPHVLKMNFATKHIDFWKTDTALATKRSGSLIGWLEQHYPHYANSDDYIPRAIVGKYLHECFLTTCERIGQHVTLRIRQSRVRSIAQHNRQWIINHGQHGEWFDKIVLTTGHEGIRASNRLPSLANERFVYPTEINLSGDSIPPGSRVLIRGFGLTAIDAILSLTEGRGGQFLSSETLLPTYVCRSSDEPLRIEVQCRSGRPMLAKPTAKVEPISDDFWMPYRQRLKNNQWKHGQLHFRSDVWSIVIDAATGLLNQTESTETATDVENWYLGWSRYRMDPTAAQRAMMQSLAVATGKRPVDIPYALGASWRRLYPELVSLLSFEGLANDQWLPFYRTSIEMERIAFGPPAESVGKLLRLIRDGILKIGVTTDESLPEYDCIVNAVLASPQQPAEDGPLSDLIKKGVVHVDAVTGAIKVDEYGMVVGKANGLAIFGRATEGWIIGNDTLSRTLHQQIERWANQMKTTTYE